MSKPKDHFLFGLFGYLNLKLVRLKLRQLIIKLNTMRLRPLSSLSNALTLYWKFFFKITKNSKSIKAFGHIFVTLNNNNKTTIILPSGGGGGGGGFPKPPILPGNVIGGPIKPIGAKPGTNINQTKKL